VLLNPAGFGSSHASLLCVTLVPCAVCSLPTYNMRTSGEAAVTYYQVRSGFTPYWWSSNSYLIRT